MDWIKFLKEHKGKTVNDLIVEEEERIKVEHSEYVNIETKRRDFLNSLVGKHFFIDHNGLSIQYAKIIDTSLMSDSLEIFKEKNGDIYSLNFNKRKINALWLPGSEALWDRGRIYTKSTEISKELYDKALADCYKTIQRYHKLT